VGVLLKARTSFWNAVEKGALESAQRNGLEVTVKAPLSESDILVQVQLLNAMVAQGVKAVVLAPNSKETLAAPVAAALAKGVKVVVIDSPVNGSMPVFVSTDHEAAGAAAAKLLAAQVSDADEVCIFKHSQSGVATALRENAAFNVLHETHPNMTIHRDIFAGAEAGLEEQKAALVFDQHPKTSAVLASSTPATMAMLKVFDQRQLAGKIKLVGFGFNLSPQIVTAIQNGALHAWVAQVPRDIGSRGLDAAAALLKGETVPEKIYCDFVIVTKDNLTESKIQALLE
jgi:ribose transport system substrate-binding protein